MPRLTLSLALVLRLGSAATDTDPLRMVVADVPYARVWAAAQEAVKGGPWRSRVEAWTETPRRYPSSARPTG